MPFEFREEDRLMRRAELGFSRKIWRAFWYEEWEHIRWAATPVDERPEGEFRPSRENFLHVLAREAYDGNYRSYELLMMYLGFPIVEVDERGLAPGAKKGAIANTGYVLDATYEQVRITFEPRGHHRERWEHKPSDDARVWLRKRLRRELRERAKRGSVRRVKPDQAPPPRTPIKHQDLHRYYDPELYDLLFKKDVEDTDLTVRQAEVVWLFADFYSPDHPSATTKAIAEHLNVSPQAVRHIRDKARRNKDLRRLLGLG